MLLQKIIILFLLLPIGLFAQTTINHSIQLTGGDTASRQISNLGTPKNAENAIRPQDVKYGTYNYALATGTDTLTLTFESPVEKLYNGDLFFFQIPLQNNDKVFLKLISMDTVFPLMINAVDTVGRGRFYSGQLIGAIYNDHKAFIITPVTKSCPTNYAKVNDNYCIEKTEKTASNFFSAVETCVFENAELCNFGEWYHACVNRSALGLTQMLNNYEWLDDASNAVQQVKTVGSGSCSTMGNTLSTTGSLTFRCCYSLK